MNKLNQIDQKVIAGLTRQSDPYLSCDDCFDQSDTQIEALLSSGQPLTEEFRVHLLACPACHDEAFSLTALTATDYGLSESAALTRLQQAVETPTP